MFANISEAWNNSYIKPPKESGNDYSLSFLTDEGKTDNDNYAIYNTKKSKADSENLASYIENCKECKAIIDDIVDKRLKEKLDERINKILMENKLKAINSQVNNSTPSITLTWKEIMFLVIGIIVLIILVILISKK